MTLFIEESIINSVKKLLAGRVNEILAEGELLVPPIEFGGYRDGSVTAPVIALSTCEHTEKERIIRLDAYTITISFAVPENPDGEMSCYAYAAATEKALVEDPTLDGVASRTVLIGKKYTPPKHAGTGEGWGLALSLRVTVEGMGNAG
jgi:hypothetical protein